MNTIFFTLLKISSQFFLMLPIIYLYLVNDTNNVGKYLVAAPILSVCIELIASEWIKLSIHKRYFEERYLNFFLKGFILVSIIFFSLIYFLVTDFLVISLLIYVLYISIVSQYVIDIYYIDERIQNININFKKAIIYKLFIFDVIIPILITIFIHINTKIYIYYLVAFLSFSVFLFVIYIFFLVKKYASSIDKLQSPYNLYPFILFKRIESQSFRLGLSIVAIPSDLGMLLPVILISRVISVSGTFFNYLNLYINHEFFHKYNRKLYIFISVVLLPILIAILLNFIILNIKFELVFCMLSLAFSSIYRLFSRGMLIKSDKQNICIYNFVLYSSAKFLIVYFLFNSPLLLVVVFALYNYAEVYYDNKVAEFYHEK